MCLCASVGKPTLLPNIMDSQLEAVRQDIHGVKEKIVRTEQSLAAAKQAGNNGGDEEVKFLRGRLEKLDSQLLSLQEEKNILLRSQASSKHAFSSYILAYLCSGYSSSRMTYCGGCLYMQLQIRIVFAPCCTPFRKAHSRKLVPSACIVHFKNWTVDFLQ